MHIETHYPHQMQEEEAKSSSSFFPKIRQEPLSSPVICGIILYILGG